MKRTTPSQRRDFYRQHLRGATYQEIAAGAGVSKECVRYWCRAQRDGRPCQSQYRRSPAGVLAQFAPQVRYVILRLKLEHPRWGRERIYYHLTRRRSCQGLKLPHPSSIGRYLQQWSRWRRRKKRKPRHRAKPTPATAVHQRWQLDFKVEIEQADGQKLALHTIMDEFSGACITAQLVPKAVVQHHSARVTWREAQATLRCGFAAWGNRPQSVQTDGESCLIGRPGGDYPSDFTLWLAGLGIAHERIRLGHCTDNAEVERGHRTVNDYALVGRLEQPLVRLQAELREAVGELTFALPSRAKQCRGQPPAQAYPDLFLVERPYRLEEELALFDLNRVVAYLATFQWQRKVSKVGVVQLGGRDKRYSLGRQHAGKEILVHLDTSDRQLVFVDADDPDTELCRRPLRGVSSYDLVGVQDPAGPPVPQQLPLLPEALRG